MKWYNTVLLSFLIGLTLSCRKDDIVPEEDLPVLGILDTVQHHPLDLASVWQYESHWNDGAPQPFDQVNYIDTISYYFAGDTVMERTTVIGAGTYSEPEVSTYYKVLSTTVRNAWTAPNYPYNTPDYQSQFDKMEMYVKIDVENEQVFMADYSYFSNSLVDYDILLYDFKTPPGQELPYNGWTGGGTFSVTQLTYMNLASTRLRHFGVEYSNGGGFSEYIDGIGGLRGLKGRTDYYPGLIHFENSSFSFTP